MKFLTMASLLEKEGYKLEDRQKIASVFYNRLQKKYDVTNRYFSSLCTRGT